VLGSVVSGVNFRCYWAGKPATTAPTADYTFLVQLQDKQGHLWAEADGNGYPPSDWQPGVQGLQLLVLRLPGDLPPRAYTSPPRSLIAQRAGLPAVTGETVITLTALAGNCQTPGSLTRPNSRIPP